MPFSRTIMPDVCLERVALINYVTRIHFGFGAVNVLADELKRLQFRHPLIVSDRGVFAGCIAAAVEHQLGARAIYLDTPSNPTEAAARDAAALYRAKECDGFLAIGGGSPIDLAKAAALLATHEGPISTYALANNGLERIRSNVPSIIAIPTTSGTGSEVARATVIVMADGAKRAIGSPYLIPKVAICDPELTLGLPPVLTAATGFDALAHCIETYCSPNINPPAEAIALAGMKRATAFLERAVADGSDRQARWHMLMAALEGGLTFQKGLGAVHALSHPLGELGLHHGTINAILLPHVLRFNAPNIVAKLESMSSAVGLREASGVIDYLSDLIVRVGLPTRLADVGVRVEQVTAISRKAELDSCNATNPVPLRASDYEAIMRAALP